MDVKEKPKKAVTKDAILESARQLFVDKGYAGTSMRDIAAASGVTQSLIHHHFGNKETLWREIKQRYFSEYVDEIDSMSELINASGDISELLSRVIDKRFKFFDKKRDSLRMLVWQGLDAIGTNARGTGNKKLKTLTDAVKKAQTSGEIRNDICPETIIFTVFVLSRVWFLGDLEKVLSERNADNYLDAIKKILIDGLKC